MKKMLLFICLSLIITGCSDNISNQDTKDRVLPHHQGIAAGKITPSLLKKNEHFEFVIKNQTKFKQTLTYPNSQLFDYEIVDSNGKVIAKGSDGRMYTQALRKVTLKQGEEYVLGKIDISHLKPGSYTINVWSEPMKHSPFKISEKITKK